MHPDRASAVMITVIENRNARTTGTRAIPHHETALVLHRLWLTKRFLHACRRDRRLLSPQKTGRQAATPAAIGHDTPAPPKAAIAGRILGEILLMMVLGKVERRRRRHVGSDGANTLGRQRRLVSGFRGPGRYALRVAERVDR